VAAQHFNTARVGASSSAFRNAWAGFQQGHATRLIGVNRGLRVDLDVDPCANRSTPRRSSLRFDPPVWRRRVATQVVGGKQCIEQIGRPQIDVHHSKLLRTH